MPQRRKTMRHKKSAGSRGEDRIGALPDVLLQHVLSFLPSDEAVRSCLVSRRWRDLWKSTEDKWKNADDMNEFVNHLLLLRDRSPLDMCEINSCPEYMMDDTIDKPFRYVELWIRYALSLKARVLRVVIHIEYERLELDTPLLSQHLTVLELQGVELDKRTLDFSSCPALKALKMTDCMIVAPKISSQSLQHLIVSGNFFGRHSRTRISVPSLVSLQLNDVVGWTPILQSMPALINLDTDCHDCCYRSSPGNCGYDSCEGCHDNPDGSDKCVLLRGLSTATNLELLADPEVFIFRRDLALCPTFSMLKTLILNEWSVAVDLHSVVCLLQLAPLLEKLTLRLCKVPEHLVEMEGRQIPTEQPYALEYLKIVEVECREVDERVHKLLKCLSLYGIPVDLMEVQEYRYKSYYSYKPDWYKGLSY